VRRNQDRLLVEQEKRKNQVWEVTKED
jgi:hypothetical protein